MRAKLWTCWARSRERPRTRSWAWDGVHVQAQNMKVGLCKELEDNIFDYGIPNAADLMRTTQEKIRQYVGIKYGEDIAN